MKRFSIKAAGFVTALVFFCGCQSNVTGAKKLAPTAEKDLLGVWAGLTEDELMYFRIELRDLRNGYCAYADRGPAWLMRIDRWEIQRGRTIQMRIRAIDPEPDGITEITGTATSKSMNVTVFGRGWHRELHLKREAEMEAWAHKVKNRMSAATSHPGFPQRNERNEKQLQLQ